VDPVTAVEEEVAVEEIALALAVEAVDNRSREVDVSNSNAKVAERVVALLETRMISPLFEQTGISCP